MQVERGRCRGFIHHNQVASLGPLIGLITPLKLAVRAEEGRWRWGGGGEERCKGGGGLGEGWRGREGGTEATQQKGE
jgi:hypothetical protein